MKLFLKATIFDKITEAIDKAKRDNRKPDYIVMTSEEHNELVADYRARNLFNRETYTSSEKELSNTMKIREFSFQEKYRGVRGILSCSPYLRVCSYESIYGAPIYVVPDEYFPV